MIHETNLYYKKEFSVMTTYRYKILNIIKFLIVSLSISIVVSQNLESFMQKTTLENSLRDKIYSEVGSFRINNRHVKVRRAR